MNNIKRYLQIIPIIPILIFGGLFYVLAKVFNWLEDIFGYITKKYINWLEFKIRAK